MRAVVLVAVACSSTDPTPVPKPALPAPEDTSHPEPRSVAPVVRVASYNLNVARIAGETTDALEGLDADIVLLQEVGRDWERVLETRFAGYPHVAVERSDRQRWGGLATLSRYPFRDARLLPPVRGPFPAWRAVFATPLGDLEILNVHLYPPIRLSRTRGWLEAYRQGQLIHVRELEGFVPSLGGGPAIIAGDLNEDASGAGVRWLGERGFRPAHSGWVPTWRWPTQVGEIKWQLDHILIRGPIEVIGAEVVDAGASDHLPIVAELRSR